MELKGGGIMQKYANHGQVGKLANPGAKPIKLEVPDLSVNAGTVFMTGDGERGLIS